MQIKLQNKAAEKCGERIKGAASKQITEGGTSYTTGQNRQRQGRIGAVSYTHLDVYKRQEFVVRTYYLIYQACGGDFKVAIPKQSLDVRRMSCLLYTSRCV